MRVYYFIVSLFSVIGISFLFENALLIAVCSLGIGIGYKTFLYDEYKDKKKSDSVID